MLFFIQAMLDAINEGIDEAEKKEKKDVTFLDKKKSN